MRITILGLPASGKSTLARAIAEKLQIPHIHIDRFWFEVGGRQGSHDTPNIERVRAHIRSKVLEAIQTNAWVSDGFYSRVQREVAERANTVIFLDIPLWRRLANHAARVLTRSTRHTEVSLWADLRFFLEIIKRNFSSAPKLKEFLQEYNNKVIILRSRKETRRYLDALT